MLDNILYLLDKNFNNEDYKEHRWKNLLDLFETNKDIASIIAENPANKNIVIAQDKYIPESITDYINFVTSVGQPSDPDYLKMTGSGQFIDKVQKILPQIQFQMGKWGKVNADASVFKAKREFYDPAFKEQVSPAIYRYQEAKIGNMFTTERLAKAGNPILKQLLSIGRYGGHEPYGDVLVRYVGQFATQTADKKEEREIDKEIVIWQDMIDGNLANLTDEQKFRSNQAQAQTDIGESIMADLKKELEEKKKEAKDEEDHPITWWSKRDDIFKAGFAGITDSQVYEKDLLVFKTDRDGKLITDRNETLERIKLLKEHNLLGKDIRLETVFTTEKTKEEQEEKDREIERELGNKTFWALANSTTNAKEIYDYLQKGEKLAHLPTDPDALQKLNEETLKTGTIRDQWYQKYIDLLYGKYEPKGFANKYELETRLFKELYQGKGIETLSLPGLYLPSSNTVEDEHYLALLTAYNGTPQYHRILNAAVTYGKDKKKFQEEWEGAITDRQGAMAGAEGIKADHPFLQSRSVEQTLDQYKGGILERRLANYRRQGRIDDVMAQINRGFGRDESIPGKIKSLQSIQQLLQQGPVSSKIAALTANAALFGGIAPLISQYITNPTASIESALVGHIQGYIDQYQKTWDGYASLDDLKNRHLLDISGEPARDYLQEERNKELAKLKAEIGDGWATPEQAERLRELQRDEGPRKSRRESMWQFNRRKQLYELDREMAKKEKVTYKRHDLATIMKKDLQSEYLDRGKPSANPIEVFQKLIESEPKLKITTDEQGRDILKSLPEEDWDVYKARRDSALSNERKTKIAEQYTGLLGLPTKITPIRRIMMPTDGETIIAARVATNMGADGETFDYYLEHVEAKNNPGLTFPDMYKEYKAGILPTEDELAFGAEYSYQQEMWSAFRELVRAYRDDTGDRDAVRGFIEGGGGVYKRGLFDILDQFTDKEALDKTLLAERQFAQLMLKTNNLKPGRRRRVQRIVSPQRPMFPMGGGRPAPNYAAPAMGGIGFMPTSAGQASAMSAFALPNLARATAATGYVAPQEIQVGTPPSAKDAYKARLAAGTLPGQSSHLFGGIVQAVTSKEAPAPQTIEDKLAEIDARWEAYQEDRQKRFAEAVAYQEGELAEGVAWTPASGVDYLTYDAQERQRKAEAEQKRAARLQSVNEAFAKEFEEMRQQREKDKANVWIAESGKSREEWEKEYAEYHQRLTKYFEDEPKYRLFGDKFDDEGKEIPLEQREGKTIWEASYAARRLGSPTPLPFDTWVQTAGEENKIGQRLDSERAARLAEVPREMIKQEYWDRGYQRYLREREQGRERGLPEAPLMDRDDWIQNQLDYFDEFKEHEVIDTQSEDWANMQLHEKLRAIDNQSIAMRRRGQKEHLEREWEALRELSPEVRGRKMDYWFMDDNEKKEFWQTDEFEAMARGKELNVLLTERHEAEERRRSQQEKSEAAREKLRQDFLLRKAQLGENIRPNSMYSFDTWDDWNDSQNEKYRATSQQRLARQGRAMREDLEVHNQRPHMAERIESVRQSAREHHERQMQLRNTSDAIRRADQVVHGEQRYQSDFGPHNLMESLQSIIDSGQYRDEQIQALLDEYERRGVSRYRYGGLVSPLYRSLGGTVGTGTFNFRGTPDRSFFKPRGTDTVPAMLSHGEFVVNARSAQRHMPILQHINDGKSLETYAHRGGPVYRQKGGAVGYFQSGGAAMAPTPIIDWSDPINSMKGVFNDAVSGFKDVGTQFSKIFDNIHSVIGNLAQIRIPDKIEMEARHDIHVTLNGGEVLTRLQPELERIAMAAVKSELAKTPYEIDSNSGRARRR